MFEKTLNQFASVVASHSGKTNKLKKKISINWTAIGWPQKSSNDNMFMNGICVTAELCHMDSHKYIFIWVHSINSIASLVIAYNIEHQPNKSLMSLQPHHITFENGKKIPGRKKTVFFSVVVDNIVCLALVYSIYANHTHIHLLWKCIAAATTTNHPQNSFDFL